MAKQLSADTMVIILTGYSDMTSAIDALRLNADDYLLKPCEPEEIFFRISNCVEKLGFKKKIKIYENILKDLSLSKAEVDALLRGVDDSEKVN